MATDDERRRVAERLRMSDDRDAAGFDCLLANAVLGYYFCKTPCEECHARLAAELAGLIDPNSHPNLGTEEVGTSQVPECDPTERGLGSIYEWCRERLDGADGAEDELYCAIMSAIEEYRHPESVTARTARAVDREALLALAEEMQGYADGAASGDGYPYVNAGELWAYADRIREACGVVDGG